MFSPQTIYGLGTQSTGNLSAGNRPPGSSSFSSAQPLGGLSAFVSKQSDALAAVAARIGARRARMVRASGLFPDSVQEIRDLRDQGDDH